MLWTVKTGNIVDETADVLICSANPHLSLSGGVGADLLAKFGMGMQEALHTIVRQHTPHFMSQGEVVVYRDDALPYRAILHAVAIDGWYDSNPSTITEIVSKALRMSANDFGARKVALAALATGYGHLSLDQFAEGIRPLLVKEFPPTEEIVICLMEDYRAAELRRCLG